MAAHLQGEGRFGEALDCLADLVFPSVLADPPVLDHRVQDLLDECGPAYLVELAEGLGVILGHEESVERWIRNLQKALPLRHNATVPARLTLIAISYMFDVLAHEVEIGEEYPALLADAGVFVAWRLVLAERFREAFAFVPKAESWVAAVHSADAHDLAVAHLRLCRARLVSAYQLGLIEAGQVAFDKAEAIGRGQPRAWTIFSAEFLTRQARRMEAMGRGAEALALADRAVAESAPEDLRDAREVRLDLRANILGARRNYSDAMEELVPGGAAAVAEVNQLILRLEAGQAIADGELRRIAERLALLHDALALDPEMAAATLDLRAKLALSTGNRDLAGELRPELDARAGGSGRAGIEASALSIAIDALAGGSLSESAVVALLCRAPEAVNGLEALLTNRVLFKLAAELPSPPVQEALVGWFRHLARTLAEEGGWEGRLQLLESTRWWYPELEFAAYGLVALSDVAAEADVPTLLHLAIALFSAGHAPAVRVDPVLRQAAHRLAGTLDGQKCFDRLADAVARGHNDRMEAAREALLAALFDAADQPGRVAGCDQSHQPQILYIEARTFLPMPEPEIVVVDTFGEGPRRLMLGETEPLADLIGSVFDHGRLRFDWGRAARLGRILIPYSARHLPAVFGIRGSGLIQAVPFAALPTRDGVPVGEVAVPVLLSGPDSRLDCVTECPNLLGRRMLIVADPDYGAGIVPLTGDTVVHPATGEHMTLDAFWAQVGAMEQSHYRQDVAPLPGSRIEALTTARQMADLLDVEMLIGPNASRHEVLSRLRTNPPAILHMAVHGVGVVENASAAHLKLARGEVIAFDEISLLDLSAVELVVLSACSTMHGGIRRGEGILALAWAFRAAGAKAVISTRWPVDDLASPLAWRAFYESLSVGGDICAALQSAQTALRKSAHFHAPYHWAVYQLIV
jgi:hypothetical protein